MLKSLIQLLRHPLLPLFVCIGLYLILILPTVPVHGISNDEFIDCRISSSYFKDKSSWLTGMDIDPSQSRLPMWLTAVGSLVDGTPDYITARYVSCFFGCLTLIGVYLCCLLVSNRRMALIATVFLAVSPYFLAFSKVAGTEGDALFTCMSAWLMLSLVYWAKSPNLGRTVLIALAAGMTVSAKVVGAVWIPAILPLLFIFKAMEKPYKGNQKAMLLLVCIAVGLAALAYGLIASGASHVANLNNPYDRLPTWGKLFHYLSVFLPWLACIGGAILWRKKTVHPVLSGLLILAGSLLTFFVVPPVHTTNGSLLQGIYREFVHNKEQLSGMAIYSAAGLNFLSVFIKNSPAVGLLLFLSFVSSFFFLKRQPLLVIAIIPLVVYPLFLVVNARAQTFYMMAVMPQLAMLGGYFLSMLYERSRAFSYILGCVCCLNLAYDLTVSYPDYHLNGYQYVGERYIAGRSSVGYKGLVQTPSDGTIQVMDWAKENIPPGDWVITYLRYRMMIVGLSPNLRLPFHVRNGLDPRRDFSRADWVLTHINYMLDTNYVRQTPRESIYTYPYFDMNVLQRDFEKVYSVKRAFGIEVATVWKRKNPIPQNE